MGLIFVMSVASQYFFGLITTSVQILVPDWVWGRISSFLTLSFSLPSLTTVLVGAIAESVGVAVAFSGASILIGIVSLVWYRLNPTTPTLDQRIETAQHLEHR